MLDREFDTDGYKSDEDHDFVPQPGNKSKTQEPLSIVTVKSNVFLEELAKAENSSDETSSDEESEEEEMEE